MDSPVFLLSWEMSEEWKNLEKWGLTWAKENHSYQKMVGKGETPFATDKSEVDAYEEES